MYGRERFNRSERFVRSSRIFRSSKNLFNHRSEIFIGSLFRFGTGIFQVRIVVGIARNRIEGVVRSVNSTFVLLNFHQIFVPIFLY